MHHSKETLANWPTLSLMQQMGNIGSEVSRAQKAKDMQKPDRMHTALERCLELIDTTIADPKNRNCLKELCRMREVVCDYFYGENEYKSTPENMSAYFLAFGVAANRK